MTTHDLPAVNAILNALSTGCLLLGYVRIRSGDRRAHRIIMLTALACSGAFLVSYLVYHADVGSVPYARMDWTRPVYFGILIPHVILATVMTPFIFLAVRHALRGRFEQHRRLVRWVYPVWLFVSVSGVMVYWMLYRM